MQRNSLGYDKVIKPCIVEAHGAQQEAVLSPARVQTTSFLHAGGIDFNRFMEFMEQLLETGIIGYIQSGMNYIIREIIALAASSEDWQQVSQGTYDLFAWVKASIWCLCCCVHHPELLLVQSGCVYARTSQIC